MRSEPVRGCQAISIFPLPETGLRHTPYENLPAQGHRRTSLSLAGVSAGLMIWSILQTAPTRVSSETVRSANILAPTPPSGVFNMPRISTRRYDDGLRPSPVCGSTAAGFGSGRALPSDASSGAQIRRETFPKHVPDEAMSIPACPPAAASAKSPWLAAAAGFRRCTISKRHSI